MKDSIFKQYIQDIPPLVWLIAKLWDIRQQTRKHKQKLSRKCMWTRAEKEQKWRKYTTRFGQFEKRATMQERKQKRKESYAVFRR